MRSQFNHPAQESVHAKLLELAAERGLYPSDDEVSDAIKSVPTHFGMSLTDFYDLQHRRTVNLFDDWIQYVDTQLWTKGVSGAGGASVINSDGLNGLLTFGSGTAANGEAFVSSTRKNWIVTLNQPMVYETRINYQEANVNNAGIFVGMTDSFGAGLLAAGAGSLKASFTGFGIFKLAGVTNQNLWQTVSSVTTTHTVNVSVTSTQPNLLTTPFGDQILRICINPISSTLAEVTYFVNDVQLRATASPGTTYPIKDFYTFAATKISPGCYLQGASTTAETLQNDYISVENLRSGTT